METKTHVCPVWVGYFLASPLRKLQQDPYRILNPYVQPGMQVLEIGPAMGFFSIPLARMTGSKGKVYSVDIQEKMLLRLEERAKKAGVTGIIEPCLASNGSLQIEFLEGGIDFCLLAYVVHEVPDRPTFFIEIADAMKPGTLALLIEPKSHVRETEWNMSLTIARECGFNLAREVRIPGSRAFELVRK
jgi:ubiquinone/menaquinone biosynthesis C-methylase UbiE